MEAIILIGVQGAGKSSFYRQNFAATHAHISLDVLRTRDREKALVKECIEAGRPFVLDDTNASAIDRAEFIRLAQAAGYRLKAYYFELAMRAAIARNNQQKERKPVPVPALIRTFKRLEPPTRAEGFDELFTVRPQADGSYPLEPR